MSPLLSFKTLSTQSKFWMTSSCAKKWMIFAPSRFVKSCIFDLLCWVNCFQKVGLPRFVYSGPNQSQSHYLGSSTAWTSHAFAPSKWLGSLLCWFSSPGMLHISPALGPRPFFVPIQSGAMLWKSHSYPSSKLCISAQLHQLHMKLMRQALFGLWPTFRGVSWATAEVNLLSI